MRTLALLWLSSAAFGQTSAVGGRIVDEFGDAVAGASIQIKDAAGKEIKATSSVTGEYMVDKLPPGAYEMTITALTMKNFVKKDLAVAAAETSRLDVKLAYGGGQTLGTLGEGDRRSAAFYASLKRPPPPTGPTPRLPDGTPDLSRYWIPPQAGEAPPEVRPEQPDPLPWADAIRRERLANLFRDLPDSRCLPAFGLGPKFVHTPSILVMLGNPGGDPPRQIFLDGRDHPKELNPTWLGHSVGHWEGDTLVVDTVGFNGLEWIYGGLPATEALHVVERFHRINLGHMETETTMEDPPMLRKPWTQKRTLNLDPAEDLEEYICTENEKDVVHLVGK